MRVSTAVALVGFATPLSTRSACGTRRTSRTSTAPPACCPNTMGEDPFQLALDGSADRLRTILMAREVSVTSAKQGGIYDGMTLLHCAATNNHGELAAMLLHHGASAHGVHACTSGL